MSIERGAPVEGGVGGVPTTRARRTRTRVRVIDALARSVISVGGVLVIIAVLGIMVYLLTQTVPLFRAGRSQLVSTANAPWSAGARTGVLDEYFGAGVFLLPGSGEVVTADLQSGEVISRRPVGKPAPGAPGDPASAAAAKIAVTAHSQLGENGAIALGFDDGSLQVGTLGFAYSFITESDQAAEFEGLEPGQRRVEPEGYVVRTPEGRLRRTRVAIDLPDPAPLEAGTGPVVLTDYRASRSLEVAAAMRADGTTFVTQIRRITPLGGGKPRLRLSVLPVNSVAPEASPAGGPARGLPSWMFISGDGIHLFKLWEDGLCQRYGRVAGERPTYEFMDALSLLPAGRKVSQATMLLGALTLVTGDDAGTVRAAFAARTNTARTLDGSELVVAHEFTSDRDGGAVTALGISGRDRAFATGASDGSIVLRHMTSAKRISRAVATPGQPVGLLLLTPKLDGYVAADSSGTFKLWSLRRGHPEASLKSLFGSVWYEGDAAPSFTYQSSAGTDSAESKISLVPLIFGTFKATLFSLLFAIPVAVFAAIYTSEMLHPRVRLAFKPAIEMMASLPSVVLGFVAAIVVAPLARDFLPAVLSAFVVVPVAVLACATLWQMLPVRIISRLRTTQHAALVGVVLLAGLALSVPVGRFAEAALFTPTLSEQRVLAGDTTPVPIERLPAWAAERATLSALDGVRLRPLGMYVAQGKAVEPSDAPLAPEVQASIDRAGLTRPNIRLWLDGAVGSAWPGWMVLLTPPAMIIVALARISLLDPALRRVPIFASVGAIGAGAGVFELLKFALTMLAGAVVGGLAAWAISSLGFDPRDGLLGTFTQRNTLVVAIVMGFAIIPIIYTISEDAMSSVPGALRSASLGCGATRWQTALNVVLPLALSGIFSACMIGLGRAAGETMIVLMATGNTPSIDWNIFAGFRTLAANIATEMPEAPQGETHYRVLFLAGLCLFIITFFVNTAAEMLRQRFRKRGAAL